MAQKKLLDQVSEMARFRHLSLRTEETYRNWIKRFILFHQKRHPTQLDAEAIRAFLTHLAVSEHVAASTQNQAFNALLFLYKQVLQVEVPRIEGVERARHSRKLPVVFTKSEASAVLAQKSASLLVSNSEFLAGRLDEGHAIAAHLQRFVRFRLTPTGSGLLNL